MFFVFTISVTHAQQIATSASISFFEPSPTYHKTRFWTVTGIGTLAYTGFSIGFYNAWYGQYPQSSFHLFNDVSEWRGIDKAGHIYGGYLQSLLCYKGARWTGLSENKAILTGALCGTLFQATIEVFDGFSTKWGFSLADIAANSVGVASFVAQQKLWHEQRITIKESVWPVSYNNDPILSTDGGSTTNLKIRTDDLYGKSWGEKALKDYNVQTYWASFNVHSFLPDGNKWPQWLNVALGYGAGGMYGGFENKWEEGGQTFDANQQFKRYSQFYIGLDYNLTKIKTSSPFIKSALSVLDIVKWPAPALEINTKGEVIFHLVFF